MDNTIPEGASNSQPVPPDESAGDPNDPILNVPASEQTGSNWPMRFGGGCGTTVAGLIWIFGFGGGILPLLLCALVIAPVLSAILIAIFSAMANAGKKT